MLKRQETIPTNLIDHQQSVNYQTKPERILVKPQRDLLDARPPWSVRHVDPLFRV